MAKQKLTPWFPPSIAPVRKGIYVASVGRNSFYRYWNGKWWSNGAYALDEVQNNTGGGMRRKYGAQQLVQWRGLTEQSK